jgi:hypothetical protein
MMMERNILAALLAVCGITCAGVPQLAAAQTVEDRERAIAQQVQAERQKRIERARENCQRNRGPDCDSLEGLQEWLMLDRSRADAVLDRVYPQLDMSAPVQTSPGSRWPSSSTGSSSR